MASRPPPREELLAQLQGMQQQVGQLQEKINELSLDVDEHRVVEAALVKVDPGRRAFRKVGGVLVERTVKEIVPAVRENKSQIEKMIGVLTEQLKARESAMKKFQSEHGLLQSKSGAASGGGGGGGGGGKPTDGEKRDTGILV